LWRCVSKDALLSKNRCSLMIIIFAWRTSFLKKWGEKQIIHVNGKQSMLADKMNRTRFKTRFQVSGNERCNVEPSAFFPSFTVVFFLFLSTAIWPFTDYKEPSSLSLLTSVKIEEACYSVLYNNAIYDKPLLSWRISTFVQSRFKLFIEKKK